MFLHLKNIVIREIVEKVKTGYLKGVYLHTLDLNEDWASFCQDFNLIRAGGGLVLNKMKEVLFIYRANKWDLPKGRSEGDEIIEETALREVEEECGVKDLYIQKFLLKTYHLFYDNKEQRLKETHWFLMKTDYSGDLKPLLKEGIKVAVFKKEKEIRKALLNTYINVITVLNSYREQI